VLALYKNVLVFLVGGFCVHLSSFLYLDLIVAYIIKNVKGFGWQNGN